jgi:type IV secretory pathway VirB6-like protein
MDQFGLNINFLWIKQVLGIVFVLKIYFLNDFYRSITVWTVPQFPESTGVSHPDLRDKVGCISYMRQRRQHI